jgi:hypothetical protein
LRSAQQQLVSCCCLVKPEQNLQVSACCGVVQTCCHNSNCAYCGIVSVPCWARVGLQRALRRCSEVQGLLVVFLHCNRRCSCVACAQCLM